MAKSEFKNASGKYLNSTEREAISKLMKIHQPILKEAEKWKEHREKLENTLLDQIEMMGKILKPYYEQSKETLANITRSTKSARRSVSPRSSIKKTSSRTSSKKSGSKKSR